MNGEFVFVDELVPGIRWDAKYATWDNFTGRPVDGYGANRIVGAKALCAPLEDAREGAASLGFGLLLWDGYRPQRAVDCFLRWSKQPENGRKKLRHYPNIERAVKVEKGYVAAKSGHSRGSSVDLTLLHLACGFSSYECEWWHYTLKAEPYPDTYFDFPITHALLDV
jgi:zinc D-Ala-D-Ala dipeptidase